MNPLTLLPKCQPYQNGQSFKGQKFIRLLFLICLPVSVTSKKLSNVCKSCPKIISLEKLKILTPLQKLPKNVGDLAKLIDATGLEKLSKVQ